MTASNKTKIAETIAVIGTGIAKFVVMDYLNLKLIYIITAIAAWAIYITYQLKTKPQKARHWGFRTDNFLKVLKMVLPIAIIAIMAFVGIGVYKQTIALNWHIIPLFILYPIWGTIQQFLIIALTLGNMQDIKPNMPYKYLAILLNALLFALIHYPFTWLMVGTFFLALFYGWLYLKERNLYVLGLFHGCLGALFYYTVLGRDPFAEIFGI
jgi:membrane protease YdiL (CAAX protease family)